MYHDVMIARRNVNRTFRRFYPRLFVTFFLIALLLGCSESAELAEASPPGSNATAVQPARDAIPVRVARVGSQSQEQTLRFAGVSRPRQRANLSFQVGGTIEARFAEIGEQVKAGEIIARLYNPQLGPASQAAEARLAQLINDAEQLERDLQRLQRIYEQNLLAIQDLEQQRTLLRSTQSAIDNARAVVAQNLQLQRESELRAPFDGRIEQVLLEPGEFAQPGQPVLRMSAEGGLEVEVRVPPHLLYGLALGDPVPVWHGLDGGKYGGTISEIGEASSGTSTLYPLVVSLGSTGLRSGEPLEVGVRLQRPVNELSVPLAAIMRSAQGLTVFRLVSGDRVERVPVTVTRITGDQVLLSPGSLQDGDSVVYAGLTRLAEGDTVTVLPTTAELAQ